MSSDYGQFDKDMQSDNFEFKIKRDQESMDDFEHLEHELMMGSKSQSQAKTPESKWKEDLAKDALTGDLLGGGGADFTVTGQPLISDFGDILKPVPATPPPSADFDRFTGGVNVDKQFAHDLDVRAATTAFMDNERYPSSGNSQDNSPAKSAELIKEPPKSNLVNFDEDSINELISDDSSNKRTHSPFSKDSEDDERSQELDFKVPTTARDLIGDKADDLVSEQLRSEDSTKVDNSKYSDEGGNNDYASVDYDEVLKHGMPKFQDILQDELVEPVKTEVKKKSGFQDYDSDGCPTRELPELPVREAPKPPPHATQDFEDFEPYNPPKTNVSSSSSALTSRKIVVEDKPKEQPFYTMPPQKKVEDMEIAPKEIFRDMGLGESRFSIIYYTLIIVCVRHIYSFYSPTPVIH